MDDDIHARTEDEEREEKEALGRQVEQSCTSPGGFRGDVRIDVGANRSGHSRLTRTRLC